MKTADCSGPSGRCGFCLCRALRDGHPHAGTDPFWSVVEKGAKDAAAAMALT